MPSKTDKQAKFMRAVAHGFKPTDKKGPPVSVAKEFVKADKASNVARKGGRQFGLPMGRKGKR